MLGARDELGFFDWLHENWVGLKTTYNGKTIGFVGPMLSGKSVWINFLSLGEFSTESKPTQIPRPVPRQNGAANTLTSEFNINLRKTLDVGGKLNIQKTNWEKVVKESDIIIYLFDCSRVLGNGPKQAEYLNEMSAHRKFLSSHDFKDKTIGIIGTHPDLISGLENENDYDGNPLFDSVFDIKEVRDIETVLRGQGKFKMIARLNSLNSIEQASKTLMQEIQRVSKR